MSFFMKFFLLALLNYVRKWTPILFLFFTVVILCQQTNLAPLAFHSGVPLISSSSSSHSPFSLHHFWLSPQSPSSRAASCVTELPQGRGFSVQEVAGLTSQARWVMVCYVPGKLPVCAKHLLHKDKPAVHTWATGSNPSSVIWAGSVDGAETWQRHFGCSSFNLVCFTCVTVQFKHRCLCNNFKWTKTLQTGKPLLFYKITGYYMFQN